jgi:hypothetical protein
MLTVSIGQTRTFQIKFLAVLSNSARSKIVGLRVESIQKLCSRQGKPGYFAIDSSTGVFKFQDVFGGNLNFRPY